MDVINSDILYIETLLANDSLAVDKANELRIELFSSPQQSNFRVIALFVLKHYSRDEKENKQKYSLVVGTNAEQGYIGGSICAERAALCKLRFIPDVEIVEVVVVTDSDFPIYPGPL
eukprot:gene13721-18406_t